MARRKDDRMFIRVHENMPEHPKIEPLSDRAFRLLVETWCWSKRTRTDGHVRAASWRKRGTPKTRRELLDAGLVEDDLAGGVIVHDYDDWQQTSDEIDQVKQDKRDAGAFGAHQRWHVQRKVVEPECEFCQPDSKAIAGATDAR